MTKTILDIIKNNKKNMKCRIEMEITPYIKELNNEFFEFPYLKDVPLRKHKNSLIFIKYDPKSKKYLYSVYDEKRLKETK